MRTDELKKSYKKFGALYPILIDSRGKTIDGSHRQKIDINWPRHRLKNVTSEVDRAIIALTANITRREITRSEITRRLKKIAELTGWSPKKIAKEIGRSYEWVIKYLPQRFKDKIKARGRKQERKQKPDARHTSNSSENPQIELLVSNVWENSKTRLDYGNGGFYGNTDPFVIKQCLLKYAPRKRVVLDPMVGSGTTIDLCNELGYKIKAYDIRPMRDDIKFGDAEKLTLKNSSVSFIFAHFPYWKKVVYSNNPNDLSCLSFNKFLDKSEKIMKEMHRVLEPNRFFVVLIGDERHNGKLKDLSSHLSLIGSKYFSLYDKIIWLTRSQSKRSGRRIEQTLMRWRAKKVGSHLINADILLVFKKEG